MQISPINCSIYPGGVFCYEEYLMKSWRFYGGLELEGGPHARADIVLMHSDLMDVPTAIQLSKSTIRNIKQNLFWAFAYNVAGIPIAAGLLFAFGVPRLNPILAAAAMTLSSVSVLVNALRLKRFKPYAKSGESSSIMVKQAGKGFS